MICQDGVRIPQDACQNKETRHSGLGIFLCPNEMREIKNTLLGWIYNRPGVAGAVLE